MDSVKNCDYYITRSLYILFIKKLQIVFHNYNFCEIENFLIKLFMYYTFQQVYPPSSPSFPYPHLLPIPSSIYSSERVKSPIGVNNALHNKLGQDQVLPLCIKTEQIRNRYQKANLYARIRSWSNCYGSTNRPSYQTVTCMQKT